MCQLDEVVREVVMANKLGLHLRPVRMLVDEANKFVSDVSIVMGDQRVDGKSFLDVMSLAAAMDAVLILTAKGPDAAETLDALEGLIRRKFDEE